MKDKQFENMPVKGEEIMLQTPPQAPAQMSLQTPPQNATSQSAPATPQSTAQSENSIPANPVEGNADSAEHIKYLKTLRKNKIVVLSLQISILIFIVALWEFATNIGIIDSFIFSSPTRIFSTLTNLAKGDLWKHIGVTLYETVVGFLLSMLIGFVVAVLLWSCETARKIFQPYLVVLNSLPKVALGPIIIVWVGSGTKAIVTMTILICVVVTTINILHGFCETDRDMIFLLKSMGATKFEIFKKLVFPGAVPLVMSTIKINVGLAFVGAIMGEYLVSRAGLGYLIVYGSQVFNLDLVMASIVVLLVLAGLIYAIVASVEKKFASKWQ